MEMTKFKTITSSDTASFDTQISCHVNNKWQLQGDPRTTVTSDGNITHFQTLKKEFDLSTDEAKILFNEAADKAGQL